nr:MAG TPA: hypothetical protein [Caudoviricetes sp.]
MFKQVRYSCPALFKLLYVTIEFRLYHHPLLKDAFHFG